MLFRRIDTGNFYYLGFLLFCLESVYLVLEVLPERMQQKLAVATVNALGIGNAQNKKLVIFFEFHEVRSCEEGVADGEVWVILPAARASLHHFAHQILFLRLR